MANLFLSIEFKVSLSQNMYSLIVITLTISENKQKAKLL